MDRIGGLLIIFVFLYFINIVTKKGKTAAKNQTCQGNKAYTLNKQAASHKKDEARQAGGGYGLDKNGGDFSLDAKKKAPEECDECQSIEDDRDFDHQQMAFDTPAAVPMSAEKGAEKPMRVNVSKALTKERPTVMEARIKPRILVNEDAKAQIEINKDTIMTGIVMQQVLTSPRSVKWRHQNG